MIDVELKKKLAQTLAYQLLLPTSAFRSHNQKSNSPVTEDLFYGLSLMNRLEEIVTKSFASAVLGTEVVQSAPEVKSSGSQYLSRHVLMQKRINESNKRMTQALLDLARRHAKTKAANPKPDFSRETLTHYTVQETRVKHSDTFRKSMDASPIFTQIIRPKKDSL